MVNTDLLCDRISAAGFTHAEIAKAIGMSKNTFSAYLNGKKSFRVDQVNILCELLKIRDNDAKIQIFLP